MFVYALWMHKMAFGETEVCLVTRKLSSEWCVDAESVTELKEDASSSDPAAMQCLLHALTTRTLCSVTSQLGGANRFEHFNPQRAQGTRFMVNLNCSRFISQSVRPLTGCVSGDRKLSWISLSSWRRIRACRRTCSPLFVPAQCESVSSSDMDWLSCPPPPFNAKPGWGTSFKPKGLPFGTRFWWLMQYYRKRR